jgi:hypothetical protein
MKKKLGEILVSSGVVSAAQLDAALEHQHAGEASRLGELLLSTGVISSKQLARALSEQYSVPFVDLPALPQSVLELVSLEFQRLYRFVPLKSEGTELFIALADLSDFEVSETLERQWTKVHLHVASGEEIDAIHATADRLTATPAAPSAPHLDAALPTASSAAVPPDARMLDEESADAGGLSEGTGRLMELLADAGTGPVIDTPFFRDAMEGGEVPLMSDGRFVSPASMRALTGVDVAKGPSTAAEVLPEWLREESATIEVPVLGEKGNVWTGALDHLAPSKLVYGLTRALLARGLLSEDDILRALGQKK